MSYVVNIVLAFKLTCSDESIVGTGNGKSVISPYAGAAGLRILNPGPESTIQGTVDSWVG